MSRAHFHPPQSVSSKVSIIIAAFNCEAYIRDAISSVMAQTEQDIEIVVVDDGSTDDTVSIVTYLASKDPRIRLHSGPHSGKPGSTRNIGLRHAVGEYIAFLDDDDLYHPDKIARSLEAFVAFPQVELVFHDVKRFVTSSEEPGRTLSDLRFMERAGDRIGPGHKNIHLCSPEFFQFACSELNPFLPCSVMFRRRLLGIAYNWFREDLSVGEDTDFWMRLIKGRRVAFVNDILSYYRQRPGSLTSDPERYLTGVITVHTEILQRNRCLFTRKEVKEYEKKLAANYFHLGYFYFRQRHRSQARAAYLRAMRLSFARKTLLAFCKTFSPERLVQYHQRRTRGR